MKKIEVWNGSTGEDWSIEEVKENFKFSNKVNYEAIREIWIHNGWIKLVWDDLDCSIYNNVFGTYVKAE